MSYYVVWVGKVNGIYNNWNECEKNIKGVKGAVFKKVDSFNEAVKAFKSHPKNYVKMNTNSYTSIIHDNNMKLVKKYEKNNQSTSHNRNRQRNRNKKKKNPKFNNKKIRSLIGINLDNVICVDASCIINEKVSNSYGKIEFRAVSLIDEEEIFSSKIYDAGTVNIAEFLAIVEALKYIESNNLKNTVIYSDSVNAISWINDKTCRTKLVQSEFNQELFEEINKALHYLNHTTLKCPVLKWQTSLWGEIPADYGRK